MSFGLVMDAMLIMGMAVVLGHNLSLSRKLDRLKRALGEVKPALEEYSRSVERAERAAAAMSRHGRDGRDVARSGPKAVSAPVPASDPSNFYSVARRGGRA